MNFRKLFVPTPYQPSLTFALSLLYAAFNINAASNAVFQSQGGDPRGAAAVDLQSERLESSQVAGGDYSVIAGGMHNVADSECSAVLGGLSNSCLGQLTAIVGGKGNLAEGRYGVVLGGWMNQAIGKHTLAGGCKAVALHKGSFVWADAKEEEFVTTSTNQFLIRARGGVGINKTDPVAALDVAGDAVVEGHLETWRGIGSGRSAPDSSLHVNAEAVRHLVEEREGVHSVVRSDLVSVESSWETAHRREDRNLAFYHNGVAVMSLGPNQGDLWVTASDRRLKKDIEEVGAGTLAKVRRLPINRFRYQGDPETRPVQTGFIAQEVQSLFPEAVREVDGFLAVDYARFGAYSIAAIKELDRENQQLKGTLNSLLKRIESMEKRLPPVVQP